MDPSDPTKPIPEQLAFRAVEGKSWSFFWETGSEKMLFSTCDRPAISAWFNFMITTQTNGHVSTRWAPISYKLSYSPYKWPYKWVTGVITPINGVTTGRGPTL